MGLDQYLYEKTYVGEEFNHIEADLTIKLTHNGKDVYIPRPVSYIISQMHYWRKANQIQDWVNDKALEYGEGVQNGVDVNLSERDLIELEDICVKVLEREVIRNENDIEVSKAKNNAEDLLPTSHGFFFGSDEYDEYYYTVVGATLEMLQGLKLKADGTRSFIYNADW